MPQVPAAPRPSSSFTLKPKSLQFPVSSAMRNLAAVRPLFTVGFTQPIYDWRIRVRVANPCEIVTAFPPPTAKPRPTTTRGTRPQICESKRPTTIEGWRARACAAARAFKRLLQKSIGHDFHSSLRRALKVAVLMVLLDCL